MSCYDTWEIKTSHFPKLFCLFFERFPKTMLNFFNEHVRPRNNVLMCMRGEMMPKMGQLELLAKIPPDTLGLLGIAVDHMFIMVSFPYMVLDW
jgi:hypothetical protein